MSYYRPSFSQTVAMTRGGRGFSSSYRGNSGGRSSWGGSDRGRGGYGPPRGGGGNPRFSSFSGGMDSRSKYSSSNERYSTSGRADYESYHYKSYRSEIPSGGHTGREGHRSPERKRLRSEGRRSHEGDTFGTSSSRYQSNSFPEHNRSFSRDRRTSPFSARRDDFRKPPPSSNSPRGGYRGRISSRGSRGARLREGPPRRRLVDSSYAIRRRIPPRIPTDYSRRLKINRLRSAITRRNVIRRHISDGEDSDEEKANNSDSGSIKKEKIESEPEHVDEDKIKDTLRPKSPKKEAVDTASDKEDKRTESDTEDKHKKEFIKLICPHCSSKCLTFSKYSIHLHSSKHLIAMRHVAMKQKSVLARMRLSQRNAQRELEKTTDDLAPRTNFCPLCKLNYKQPKATHQASDAHKNMKKFLMPYCRICRITFKSPMLYETHICSIEHIKRKSRIEMNGEKSDEKEDVGSDSEEANLENFMTIDSVGDVDDETEAKKKEVEVKPKEPISVGIEKIHKIEVYYCDLCRMYLPRVDESELSKMLAKHCKQRTHMQRYIRYKEDKELASRAEKLQRKETAEKAEKEKEKIKIKEEQKKSDKVMVSKKDEEEKSNNQDKEKTEEDKIADDKLWADDVNKDLGDILAEAESGNKTSDEDEDCPIDEKRYDRFGCSEKNGDDKKEDGEIKQNDVSVTEEVKNETVN